MFSNKNPFINERRPQRSQSVLEHQLRAVFHEPPLVFNNHPLLHGAFDRLYWYLRSVQLAVLYKTEEADATSIGDLLKFEPLERPPSLEQLQENTKHRFSHRWIKYMYAKFKNECPTGRMRVQEFKRVFGVYIPHRLSDAYLDRMFRAFLHASPYPDQITFSDLISCLSALADHDAAVNAEWTMRLINGNSCDRISFPEFKEFVQSVFLLTGGDANRRADSVITTPQQIDENGVQQVRMRATLTFKELDKESRGYLTQEDFKNFFRHHSTKLF